MISSSCLIPSFKFSPVSITIEPLLYCSPIVLLHRRLKIALILNPKCHLNIKLLERGKQLSKDVKTCITFQAVELSPRINNAKYHIHPSGKNG